MNQQVWLRDYLDDWFFWYADSPRPSPAQFTSVETCFNAMLSPGRPPDFPPAGLGLRRVIVLIGPRTCSASEQLVNGLLGAGIEVLALGDTTSGKPAGFLPTSACGRTYRVVNFESVNALNEGCYFDGLAPTCPVAEDFKAAMGSAADPLWAAATHLADQGACPSASTNPVPLVSQRLRSAAGVRDSERQDMIPR